MASGQPVRPLVVPRGSSSSGDSPEHHSTGYLGDIVSQAMKRPSSSSSRPARAEQPHPAQGPSALAHTIQGHPTQGDPKQLAGTSHHHIKTPGLVNVGATGTYKRPRKDHQYEKLDPELKKARPQLGYIGASIRPSLPPNKPKEGRDKPKRGRGRPTKRPEDAIAGPTQKAANQPAAAKPWNKGQGAWWNRAGGIPYRSQGTGPRYESLKKYRDNKKLRSSSSNPPDVSEHPYGPPHQGPHGGPPSPDAGSHAVSKRGLLVAGFEV